MGNYLAGPTGSQAENDGNHKKINLLSWATFCMGVIDYHRIWRLYSFGAIEFISQFGKKEDQRKEYLGNMIIDTFSFFQVSKKFMDKLGYFGKSYFKHEIHSILGTKLIPKMPTTYDMTRPTANSENDYDVMNGISLGRDIVDSTIGPNQNVVIRNMDYSEIEEPTEMIADSFLRHLRMIFHGSVEFNMLLDHIRALRESLLNILCKK